MSFNWKKIDLRKNIKIILAIFVLILSFIIFILSKSTSSPPQEVKVVEVEKVAKKDIHQTIKLIGKIKARSSTNLNAKFPGILNIIVQSGEKVSKDAIIAKIISIEIEKRYILASSSEMIAKEQFERAEKLFKAKAYSKADFESLHSKWLASQKELADAKHNFDKLQIVAPFDGVMGTYRQKDGTLLAGNELLANFYDPTNLTVDFDIPADTLPFIEAGQNIVIEGKNYQLKNVQKMLDDDKHMSPASIDIVCESCIIGASVDVELYVKSKQNVITIPFDAVVIRGGKLFVYIVDGNKVNLRMVEFGMRQQNNVEIISGLEVGETIVVKAVNRLYPEALIKVYNEDENKKN